MDFLFSELHTTYLTYPYCMFVCVYASGHSDVVMGAICTNNEEVFKKLKYLQNCKLMKSLTSTTKTRKLDTLNPESL